MYFHVTAPTKGQEIADITYRVLAVLVGYPFLVMDNQIRTTSALLAGVLVKFQSI